MTRSVGSAAVRSAQLRRAELRYGGWLRWTSLRSDHRSHAPTLRIRPPPLRIALYSAPSVARPKSGIWHCCAEPRLFVRCGLRPPPCFLPPYSPLQGFGGGRPPPRGCRHTALKIIACLFLGVARSGTLVAPYGRSAAFPLPRFSPSLATLGHLPRWGLYVSFWGVRAAIPAPPTAQPTYRHAQKRLGPFLCGVGYALRRALSEHRIERNGVPRPISIFYPITASL